MITFSQLIFDTLELLKGYKIPDDVDITEPLVMFHLNTQRALWIRNEYNKPGRSIDPEVEQDLGCLELEEVDSADCCNIETECYALRTKKKIPSLIELHDKTGITRVGLPDKLSLPFTYTSYNKVIYSLHNKYAKNQVYAFLLNGYMYIITNNLQYKLIDYINVRGIFENPMDLAEFKCGENSCFSLEDNYPIKSWMIPYIRAEVVKALSGGLAIPKDSSNDANDKITEK